MLNLGMKDFKELLYKTRRKYILKYEIHKFDRYRIRYDSLTFKDKKNIANKWLIEYPEQAYFNFEPIDFWLKNFVRRPAKIIEIGGWKGDLALKILSHNYTIDAWHNYDLVESNNIQKCVDEKYKFISLNDYIWNYRLVIDYNALIATHMIEHIKWHELIKLIDWIPKNIYTVLFESPLSLTGGGKNWKGDHSSHILEKGWKNIIREMNKYGFRVEYNDSDTYVFNR